MQMTDYQHYIHQSRYARWLPDKGRRETWDETVDRLGEFLKDRYPGKHGIGDLVEAVRRMDVMPSMRLLMTAGPAAKRDNACVYNCAYTVVDNVRTFDVIMHNLMNGTGQGYSVESQYVSQLPTVPSEIERREDIVLMVPDSKAGWADTFRSLLGNLWIGNHPTWDVSRVRPAGARLKTFGGRASGPEPLVSLFKYAVETFHNARGRRLTPLEVHDLICKVADVVVVGGVRRSALISLFDSWDVDMRTCKTGNWYDTHPWRGRANNSAVYNEKPSMTAFMKAWQTMYTGRSGEPGIFSRIACQEQSRKHGREVRDFGTNPCSEIILRPNQFCNLTEVVLRPDDDADSICRKVRQAAALGTLQAGLTDFKYLPAVWRRNCEEEALLGVSLTGVMDFFSNSLDCRGEEEAMLAGMQMIAVEENELWAKRLGINPAAAVTCVKPSGTVSQLVDSASGMHPRYAPFYIRRVTGDKKDPLTQMMADQGVPHTEDDDNRYFAFPMKAPDHSWCVEDVDAKSQLRMWTMLNEYWCQHKPSCTIYYKDDEFLDLGQEVWNNFDKISGVAFFPVDDHAYDNAPYEAITEDTYNMLQGSFPKIDWSKLGQYEDTDMTTASQELACAGGACEL